MTALKKCLKHKSNDPYLKTDELTETAVVQHVLVAIYVQFQQ